MRAEQTVKRRSVFFWRLNNCCDQPGAAVRFDEGQFNEYQVTAARQDLMLYWLSASIGCANTQEGNRSVLVPRLARSGAGFVDWLQAFHALRASHAQVCGHHLAQQVASMVPSLVTDEAVPWLRLLVADDEPRARQALQRLFNGVVVSCGQGPLRLTVIGEAATGQEAVRQAVALRPDVVLLDYRMPGMDGLAAAAAIKAQCPGTRVVMLTMYPAQRTTALASGADAFLLKGCPIQQLLAAITGSTPLAQP